MIVLWGLESDTPLAMVGAALSAAGEPVFFLDQAQVCTTRLSMTAPDGSAGEISDGAATLDLATVQAIYLRPFDTRRLPAVAGLAAGDPAYLAAIQTDEALLGWCDTAPALVMNRPAPMASNNSKPYQSALIAKAGFLIPETIVTTDAAAVLAFQERHQRIIYKSTSGIRSIVASAGADLTSRLTHLASCPTQFQEYVAGVDVRVHVVGEAVFATEIQSEAEDYRYAARQGQGLTLAAITLPDDVAARTVAVAHCLGLTLAGVDLRRCPDGRWVCFEVNPSPGFSFYERATGQGIAASIAALLAAPGR